MENEGDERNVENGGVENERGNDDVDESNGTKFEMLKSDLLIGQSQYLGGDESGDYVYFIPGHALRVLVIHTKTDKIFHIGPEFVGKFKWLRSIKVGSILYGIPCHADSVLRIDTTTQTVTTIPLPDDHHKNVLWKYHGGACCPTDGNIYTMPQYATRVLQINPNTDTLQYVGAEFTGKYKWYGAIVGSDNAIYGIPQNSPHVIRIDPNNHPDDIVTLHGNLSEGGHKWHGGASVNNGQVIVGVPCHANTVLRIDPAYPEPKISLIGDHTVVQSGRHQPKGHYKFLGADVITHSQENNCSSVYFLPSGAERVLQYYISGSCTSGDWLKQIGPNLRDENIEPIFQNKWQNGFVSSKDGCAYAIPLNGNRILQIKPKNNETTLVNAVGPIVNGLNKWEGCIPTQSGSAYCVPNNYKGILKISTHEVSTTNKAPVVLYPTGIPTLRSTSHRVRKSNKKRSKKKNKNNTSFLANNQEEQQQPSKSCRLPLSIRRGEVIPYNVKEHDLQTAVIHLLQRADSTMVGTFQDQSSKIQLLEHFHVAIPSLKRCAYGGQIEDAQQYLSNHISTDEEFLGTFDSFVEGVILPWLKTKLLLLEDDSNDENKNRTFDFYVQRPPTLRLQPGPSQAMVRAHSDNVYGHQDGELNFWIPLVDLSQCGNTYLHVESEPKKGDYHPIFVKCGEIISFFGSFCRHYIPPNTSPYTRVSLDFRVGIIPYYDASWQMIGTTADHTRRKITY